MRAYAYLGWATVQAGEPARAQRYFDAGLQTAPGHPGLQLGAAYVRLLLADDLPQTSKQVRALVHDLLDRPAGALSPPTLALVRLVNAQMLLSQGQAVAAQEEYAAAVQLDPDSSLLPSCRAEALLASGNASAAVPLLQQLHRQRPNDAALAHRLVSALTRSNAWGESRSLLAELRQKQPQSAQLDLLEGELLAAHGDAAGAARAFASIGRSAGNSLYVAAQIDHSALLRSSKQDAAAVQRMEALLGSMPDVEATWQSRSWCELGMAYEAAGAHAKAQQSYLQGVQQDPRNLPCQLRLCHLAAGTPEGQEACKHSKALGGRDL